jgi:hypothetical protein
MAGFREPIPFGIYGGCQPSLVFQWEPADEKEARRSMSPRLPTFEKNKGAKVGHPATQAPPKCSAVFGHDHA